MGKSVFLGGEDHDLSNFRGTTTLYDVIEDIISSMCKDTAHI